MAVILVQLKKKDFIRHFEEAGFYGIEIDKRESTWTTINDIEFRSITITAYKGKEGQCIDKKQSVIYKGLFVYIDGNNSTNIEESCCTSICDC
ncbi:hypothetical protein [Macrococcoides caseolyticum]|uniref:hypothetical protein n=1 Tax=Macrococcoides caseolyticum TaxID=69966 RepID=UPI0024BC9C85|nr:hypothetical protein [Macrococcus caseolyticus]MDJ1089964.1 hypothetical protein [Macrococcus caseolyticus]